MTKQFYRETKKLVVDIPYAEQIEMFKQLQIEPNQQIKDKLFNANIKLVYSITKRYKHLQVEDVEQCGFIGLVNAINKFNPESGFKFSTYATKCITNEINNGLTKINQLIPIPKHLYKKVKDGEILEISTTNILDAEYERQYFKDELEDRLSPQCQNYNSVYEKFLIVEENNDNGIDKDMFWLTINEICTNEELDILIKKFLSEDEMSLSAIAKSIGRSPQYTNNKIQRLIKKLQKNEVFQKIMKNTL